MHIIKRNNVNFSKSSKSKWLFPIVSVLVSTSLAVPFTALAHVDNVNNDISNRNTAGQKYRISDFSDQYEAVVTVGDSLNESNTIVEVSDKKSKNVLISQPTVIDIEYELDVSKEHGLDENAISANIVEAPYGDQSILIYEDFNFDNLKDIALKDGKFGCYGGSSYQVYLRQGKRFVLSPSFTDLTHGNCGFFGIDKATQTLHTMTKSGAAWHQYSTFKVIKNKPVAVRVIEEEYNLKGLISITETTRDAKGNQQVEEYLMLPDAEEQSDYLFSYALENGKKMALNSYDGEHLYYVFADQDNKIELLYEGKFIYDERAHTLSFYRKPVTYQINDKGITVNLPKEKVVFKPKPNGKLGNLDDVKDFKNVKIIR